MESLQQLYTLVEKKYQEALINELSQAGNSVIIGMGRVPDIPAKPNRLLFILLGLILAPIVAFSYILIKDYFDDSVKTPGDIERMTLVFFRGYPIQFIILIIITTMKNY